MTDNDARPGPFAGAKDHWVGIVDAAHDRIAGKVDARRTAHVAGLLEQIEADIVPALAPFLAHVVDDPTMPPEVRDLVRSLLGPEHFGQSLILGIALGSVLSPVLGSVTAPFTQSIANGAWHNAPTMPLSPAEVALGVLRHNPHVVDPYLVASQSGIAHDDLDAMIYNTGEPISVGDGLLLYRRGQIDEERLRTLVRQSRVRDEWFGSVLDLRFAPPPPGEIIAAAIKNHLDGADARRKLGEAGIDPENFEWMRLTAGRPPGTEQMLHLWNRGEATESDVDDAIHQSDIHDRFLPFVKQLRWYVPPVRSIMAMLRAGAIDDAHATRLLQENGVRPEDIPVYIAEGHHTRTQAVRELSQSQVVRMHEARLIDRAAARARLVALRYTAADADLLLNFADDARHERLTNALIAKVGALFVAHKIDRSEATVALNDGAVPADAQADLFHVWTIERAANVHHPTPAQVIGAYRREEIGAAETKARLLRLGVHLDDMGIFVADGWPPGKPGAAQAAADRVVNA